MCTYRLTSISFLVLFMPLTNHAKLWDCAYVYMHMSLCCARTGRSSIYIRPAHIRMGSRSPMRIPWVVAAVGPGPRVVLRLQVHPPRCRCLLTVGEQRLSSDRLLQRHLQPVFGRLPRQQQPPVSVRRGRCKDEQNTRQISAARGLRG
jgi:hypothetical protein